MSEPALKITETFSPTLSWEPVKAWTETRKTMSYVARPASIEESQSLLKHAAESGRTICARGSGYSYADMILNDGQIILDMARFDRILSFEPETGRMVVEPAVTVSRVLAQSLIHGWTLPSCTGGMGVSMGGAASNNVHGKDSWKDGNFGENIVQIKLLVADGRVLSVSRSENPELFQAVIGGMGLLGVIVELTLQLKKVPSPFVEARTIPVRNMEESLEVMERHRADSDFIISWVDAFAKGLQMGRGTVEVAKWIDAKQPALQEQIDDSLVMPTRIFGVVPAAPAWSVGRHFFRPSMMKMANRAKYHLNRWRGASTGKVMLFTDFNFMLNKIPGWKRLYMPHGYVEMQPLLPRQNGVSSIKEVLRFCQQYGAQSVLCAAKMHRPDDYLISFEGDGYDIGVDVTLRGRSPEFMKSFAREFYTFVAGQGGKAFLAKDELLPVDLFRRMYPRHQEFKMIKDRIDPHGVLCSDMYRRLFLS